MTTLKRARKVRKAQRQFTLFVPVVVEDTGVVGWRVDPTRAAVARDGAGRAWVMHGKALQEAFPDGSLESKETKGV